MDQKVRPTTKPIQGKLPESSGSTNGAARVENSLLKIAKTIRIAVTGDVLITALEKEIIDTPDFQRLRGVRQLGSVNYVYPTALHTRFDHSLGTLAMAARMIRTIRDNTHSSAEEYTIDPIQEVITRLYALLHDVPHVPFGHTIEDELELFKRHDKNPERFERFFGEKSQIGPLINQASPQAYERFKAIYRWNGKLPHEENDEDRKKESKDYQALKPAILKSITENDDAFIYDIVSNTVCADLLDYLERDSYFCNLGVPLEYRFLNFLYLRRGTDGVRRVFVRLWKEGKPQPRRDTLTDLARLLEARYIIAERAYFHHAKIISGAMLGRALQEAVLSKEITEVHLYDHTDDTLIRALKNSKNAVAKRLATQLLSRRLFKSPLTLRYSREGFAGLQQRDYGHNVLNEALSLVADPANRIKVENQLADELGANPGDVIIYAPEKNMNLKVADMKVLWKGEATSLKDIDDPVTKPRLDKIIEAHRMLWAIQVIFNPDLTEAQQAQLRRACDILFACSVEDQAKARQAYYEDLIEQALQKGKIKIPSDMIRFAELRTQAASDLQTTSEDKRSWGQRIEAVARKYFSSESGE